MKQLILKVKDASEMNCFVAEPAQKARAAVIVLQEAFGVTSHMQDLTKRFAKEGYLAITPELFHRSAPAGWTCPYDRFDLVQPHMSAMTEAGIIDDVQACFDWVNRDQGVSSVGTSGYCLGGRASYIANSQIPLRAAVSYYGGRIAPSLLPLASRQIAPLLFFWGGLDTHIPADQVRQVTETLDHAKKPYTNITISDADHGFFTDDKSSYNPKASRLAWATTLEFLKMNLLS